MVSGIAGIDVHKRVLMVVLSHVSEEGRLGRGRFGTTSVELERLAEWFQQQGVEEVVMESTAQYWKPVWLALEDRFRLHLAQAQSNRAPKGRKRDFADAERLVRRLLAGELILSYVPDPEQRLWRTLTHSKIQMKQDQIRIGNQLEALLEDARIKLSSFVSDLLGVSARRMLKALAEGSEDLDIIAGVEDLTAGAAAGAPRVISALERHLVLTELVQRWAAAERAPSALGPREGLLEARHHQEDEAEAEAVGAGHDAELVGAHVGGRQGDGERDRRALGARHDPQEGVDAVEERRGVDRRADGQGERRPGDPDRGPANQQGLAGDRQQRQLPARDALNLLGGCSRAGGAPALARQGGWRGTDCSARLDTDLASSGRTLRLRTSARQDALGVTG